MSKYNDGLNNETEIQIMSTYRRPPSQQTKEIVTDLGSVPQSLQSSEKNLTNAVMFSNSISNSNSICKLNIKEKEKTLQQADNEAGIARTTPKKAFGPGVREDQKTSSFLVGIRDLSSDLHIVQVEIQVANIRKGKNNRADVYINLMTENDKIYTIKLVSNVTNAFSEVKRSCANKKHFSDWAQTLIDSELPELMIGRARYKLCKDRPLWQTKPNLGNVLVAYFIDKSVPTILLFLFGDEPIVISLDKELTDKQKAYYTYRGVWCKELPDLE